MSVKHVLGRRDVNFDFPEASNFGTLGNVVLLLFLLLFVL